MKKHIIRDVYLENFANDLLIKIGYDGPRVYVYWNNKLKTTAGWFLRSGRKRIHLNILLSKGKLRKHLICTLKHELAHVLAYYRAGKLNIKVHGQEWVKACGDLGIPKEKPKHKLVLKIINVRKRFFYFCPLCLNSIARVRPFIRPHACIDCCKKYTHKVKYDRRFQMKLIKK